MYLLGKHQECCILGRIPDSTLSLKVNEASDEKNYEAEREEGEVEELERVKKEMPTSTILTLACR